MAFEKGLYLIFTVLMLIVLVLGITGYWLFWGGSYLVFKVNSSAYVVDKIRQAEKQGGTLELTEADFNALLELSVRNRTLTGNFKVDGIYARIKEGKLNMYLPLSYHGLNFFVLSSSDLIYNDERAIFKPDYFRVGKIKLPSGFVAKETNFLPDCRSSNGG